MPFGNIANYTVCTLGSLLSAMLFGSISLTADGPQVAIVCMYGHHIYSKGKDQPGKVANPALGQLNRDKENVSYHVPTRA